MRARTLLTAAVAVLGVAAAPAGAQAPPGWAAAVDARRDLGAAQTALALGEGESARVLVARAERTLTPLAAALPGAPGRMWPPR